MRAAHDSARDDPQGTFKADLSDDGFPAVPLLYRSGYAATRTPTPLHVHPGCTELALCLRGCLTFETEDACREMRPNELIVIPEETRHRLYTTRKGVSSCGLCFRDGAVDANLRRSLAQLPRDPMPQRADTRRALLKMIEIHRSWPDDALKAVALATFFNVLVLSVVESARTAKGRPAAASQTIRGFVEEIRRNPIARRSVSELARRANVSESLLTAEFCRLTGYPPHAFMVRERLKAAMRLLRAPHATLGGVAFKLGYISQQHFSAQFTRYCGITPRAYRAGADATL